MEGNEAFPSSVSKSRGSIHSLHLDIASSECDHHGTGSVICRIAYTPPIAVETHKFMWLLSSNKASVTPDLAARALITRMRKQPDSHKFHEFEGGRDLLKEVQHNCPYYLSCILSIIRAWFSQGCPRSNDRRHDFSEACQALDWIIQNIFKLPPLLDDHQAEQARVANPLLNWLRDVALLVEKNSTSKNGFAQAKSLLFVPITVC